MDSYTDKRCVPDRTPGHRGMMNICSSSNTPTFSTSRQVNIVFIRAAHILDCAMPLNIGAMQDHLEQILGSVTMEGLSGRQIRSWRVQGNRATLNTCQGIQRSSRIVMSRSDGKSRSVGYGRRSRAISANLMQKRPVGWLVMHGPTL
jgi:hypothetical protein